MRAKSPRYIKRRDFQRAYYAKHAVTRREYRRRYYHSHKKECNESFKKWNDKNREHRAKYMAVYNAKRKVYQKEYDRLRHMRLENIAKRERLKPIKKAYMQVWAKNNKDKRRLAYAKRRALKRGNRTGNPRLIAGWIRSWQSLKRIKCYWCSKIVPVQNCHADHIYAISLGGEHSVENLCVSCADCNRRKHNSSLRIWNQQISQPILL